MKNRLSILSSSIIVGSGPLDAPVQRKRRATKRGPPLALTNGEEGETTVSAAELTRRRNALYSRRSNKRRDLALLSLQDQKSILTVRNAALRADNARLEQLLAGTQMFFANNNSQQFAAFYSSYNHGPGTAMAPAPRPMHSRG